MEELAAYVWVSIWYKKQPKLPADEGHYFYVPLKQPDALSIRFSILIHDYTTTFSVVKYVYLSPID